MYHVFNKDSGCVETTCYTMFDETNGSQVEQYDLDVVDDEEAPCDAVQTMAIGDIGPQDPSEPQANQSPNDTTPPTQDQENEQDQDQEENIDQGGDEKDGDHKGSRINPPHTRVHQTIQKDHLVDNIFCDIKKG
jgi:hypothetical protein